MNLQLIKVDQADQLSACKMSLLLGVFTPKNQLENFLRFARGILNAESAILAFHDEPYVWYSSPDGFKAVHASADAELLSYFDGESAITSGHCNYSKFSKHISKLGVQHQRLLAIDLKVKDEFSIGQVVLFDDEKAPFEEKNLALVYDFAVSLIRILEVNAEYAELKELYEQQSALNFSKTKFFQIIAHDLRAPFHGLLGFSDVLANERESLDERSAQNIAEYLHDTAQSTYNLLESLLSWAMAEGGRFVYHPIHFELKQVTRIVYDVLNTLAVKKNIRLVEDVPLGLKVYADINMMTSVIQNLVSNALKFTQVDGTGTVHICAEQTEKGIEISIKDNGLGMSDAQIEKLFQPDLKISIKGTSGENGAGLGLVLCKRFVDLNHGELSVISKKGIGTIFNVVLPAVESSSHLVSLSENSAVPITV